MYVYLTARKTCNIKVKICLGGSYAKHISTLCGKNADF
jgi:hypothetical protein